MPCDYSLYPPDWNERRARVLKRARNRCERCGLPNKATVFRCDERAARAINRNAAGFRIRPVWFQDAWMPPRKIRDVARREACIVAMMMLCVARGYQMRPVTIVLTVAHLDRTGAPGEGDGPLDCADDRLQALCQACHLRLDAKRHAAKAAQTRARRKYEGQPALALLEA